eukprot:TRINITY_DN4181_c1_g1_i4.p7 TRINITY_DN4181_c1_g1~~TRINITY_DN4181_c1_g1_i4.p7  ORF type:complete len:105 (-),score=5.20 TRINITY_DN4181_c1_g1_i4:616-909(-)
MQENSFSKYLQTFTLYGTGTYLQLTLFLEEFVVLYLGLEVKEQSCKKGIQNKVRKPCKNSQKLEMMMTTQPKMAQLTSKVFLGRYSHNQYRCACMYF